MTDLLKRWAPLEPARCTAYIFASGVTTWSITTYADGRQPFAPHRLGLESAVLIATIEAIAVRHWHFHLETQYNPSAQTPEAHAIVRTGLHSYLVYAATIAEALLGAYLEALEAQARA